MLVTAAWIITKAVLTFAFHRSSCQAWTYVSLGAHYTCILFLGMHLNIWTSENFMISIRGYIFFFSGYFWEHLGASPLAKSLNIRLGRVCFQWQLTCSSRILFFGLMGILFLPVPNIWLMVCLFFILSKLWWYTYYLYILGFLYFKKNLSDYSGSQHNWMTWTINSNNNKFLVYCLVIV